MGKVIKYVRRIFLICAILTIMYNILVDIYGYEISANTGLRILKDTTPTYYSMVTDNSGYTNINGISNVYHNLNKEGYGIHKEDITKDYVDVVFVKDNSPSYRYYYEWPEMHVTFFSSNYEASYLLSSYIIEENELE